MDWQNKTTVRLTTSAREGTYGNQTTQRQLKQIKIKKEMQSHENCLSQKVRSKDVRNNEKLNLSGNENKF